MQLAVVDSFVRPETSKGASRSGEVSSVSFSDVLDATDRRAEPASARAADRAADRAANSNSPSAEAAPPRADDTKPATTDDKPAAHARAKPKSEAAPENTDTPPAAEPAPDESTSSTDAANVPTPTDGASSDSNGKGAAALDLIAALLATGEHGIDTTIPKGQMVAAIVVPQNVPEHAAAAGHHTIPGLTAPAAPPAAPANSATPPAPSAPVPDATTPAFEAAAPASAPTPSTPTPPPASSPVPTGTAGVATPVPSAVPTSEIPPTSAPDETQVPQPVAAAPAPVPAGTTATTPPTMPSAVDNVIAELAADLDALPLETPVADEVASPLTPATTTGSGATAARPAANQVPSSGYVAQMVSQDAFSDAPAAPAPVIDEKSALQAAASQPTVADAPAQTDDAIAPAKPADMLAVATADAGGTHEAHAVESTAAARGARPPVMPLPEQVVVRIAKAVADGVDRINVKLSPAELGHIDVRMEIGPDGRFQAVFAADRPQTVELLQRDARELARALQDAGLRADTGSLSFNLRGQGGQQGNADSGPSRTGLLPLAAGGEDLPGEAAPLPAYRAAGLGNGRVDIRV